MKILKNVVYFSLFVIVSCGSVKDNNQQTTNQSEISNNLKVRVLGNEPFWNIDVYDTYAIYNTPETPKKQIKIDWNEIEGKYVIKSLEKNLPLQITLENDFCSDGMSDTEYNYKAEGTINGKVVNGCAKWFMNDDFKGKWNLKSSKGQQISNFSNLPYLELDSDTMRVSGNAGCNGIAGAIIYKNGKLTFNYLSTTLMWCDDMEHEATFIKNLKGVDDFKVEDNLLLGYKNGQLILEFKR